MKKILLVCILAIGMTACAQNQVITKKLQLNNVPNGLSTDKVMVIGTDKVVKQILSTNLKVVDTTAVHKTGPETITGTKTIVTTGEAVVGLQNNVSNDAFGNKTTLNSGGTAFSVTNNSTGTGFASNTTTAGTGYNFLGKNNGADTFKVNKLGDITGNSIIKTGGTSSQVLLADGTTGIMPTPVNESNLMHLTGNETFSGIKTIDGTSFLNYINGINTNSSRLIRLTNQNSSVGATCLEIANLASSPSTGIYIANTSNGRGEEIANNGTGVGKYISNTSTGYAQWINNSGTGVALRLQGQTSSTGKLLSIINNITETANITKEGNVTANSFKITALNTGPATASSTGIVGEIRYDADYMYLCTATDTWKRSALTTW